MSVSRRPRPPADDRNFLPLRRTRVKFVTFALLTVLAAVLRLPIWSQVALLATTVMIPIAIALYGGRRLLGAFLRRQPHDPLPDRVVDSIGTGRA